MNNLPFFFFFFFFFFFHSGYDLILSSGIVHDNVEVKGAKKPA